MSMQHVFDIHSDGTAWIIDHHSPGQPLGPWVKATKTAAIECATAMARWVSGKARVLTTGESVEEEWDYR